MVTRIRQLLEYKQLTPTQFADLIGVGRPVVSHILSERNKPSLEVAQRIGSAFQDISLAWLLFGTGEMLGAESAGPAAALAPLAAPVAESAAPIPASEPLPAAPVPAEAAPPAIPDAAIEPAASIAPLPTEVPFPAASKRPQEALPRPFSAPQPVVAVPPTLVPATTPATLPATALEPVLPSGTTPEAGPAGPRPFRSARFVPVAPGPPPLPLEAARPATLPTVGPVLPAAGPQAALPAAPVAPHTTAAALPAGVGLEAAMLPFLSESGKAIRRIVIFYRDGSFADYQPE